jgi:hypothetical protein
VNSDTGPEVKSMRATCGGTLVDLPAGNYELAVSPWDGPGTYKLDIYEQPPPQVYDVTVPTTVSDGVPAAGAGKLETPVSEDRYTFSTVSKKTFRIEFWDCRSGQGGVLSPIWELVDAVSGATIKADAGCAAKTVPDLPAGSYRLKVTRPGDTGSYKLRLAPRELIPIALPGSISDGVPVTGAGRIETPVAEDAYSFSTAAAGSLQVTLSQCQPALQWQLVDAGSGAEVKSERNSCSGTLVSALPAGNYELYVSMFTGPNLGTYKLDIFKP